MEFECYSIDDETYSYLDMNDAIDDRIGSDESIQIGSIFWIYVGIATKPVASKFFPKNILELMDNYAFDEFGEYSEGFLSCSREIEEELVESLKKVVDDWATKYSLHPNFWGVDRKNIINVKIIDEDFNWEIVK